MQTCEKLVRINKKAHEVGMGKCSELLPQTAEAITSLLLLRWPPRLWKLKRQDQSEKGYNYKMTKYIAADSSAWDDYRASHAAAGRHHSSLLSSRLATTAQ